MNEILIKFFKDGKGIFYQRVKVSDNIEKEEQTGFLYCKNSILGHIGVQEYHGFEVGLSDKSVVQVKREPQDVFDENSIKSFDSKPITLFHPDENVNSKNFKKYAVGVIKNVWHDEDNIYGDLVIMDESAIEKVESGELKDLSLGYEASLVPTLDGALKQENIVINHLAIVKEGRAQNARIVDEKTVLEDTLHVTERETVEKVMNSYDDETGEEATIRTTVETVKHSHYEELMKEYKDSIQNNKKEENENMEKDFKYFMQEFNVLKSMPKSDFRDKAFEALNAECQETLKVELPKIEDVVVVKDSVIEKTVALKDTKVEDETEEKPKVVVVDAQAEERFFNKLYRDLDKKEKRDYYTSLQGRDVADILIEKGRL